jgi:hypothetical protein
MAATAIDSLVFRDIFGTSAMRQVFSDESRVQYYLDIEAALARVQGHLGIIPAEAAEEIGRQCSVEKIEMAKLKQATERLAIPSCRWCNSSSDFVSAVSASGATGAPPPRTSPTPLRFCRYVLLWLWSNGI